MFGIELHRATPADLDFLWDMLYASIFVPAGTPPPPRRILDDPKIAHYLTGWGRAGDYALVATQLGRPVGAAWYRLLLAEDPGYGFVAADVPELGIALKSSLRGQGIGTSLLEALIAHARAQGYRALSLSVHPDNPALRLYQRFRFIRAASYEDAWTMVLSLKD